MGVRVLRLVAFSNIVSFIISFLRHKAKEDMQLVIDEHVRHRDVIMHDFMDSYGNLTLKTLTAMRWAVRFCNNSRCVCACV